MLFAKIIPFHRTKSGSISRAQKYKIKSKPPYKLLQKSFNHLYNINILAKKAKINPIIIVSCKLKSK